MWGQEALAKISICVFLYQEFQRTKKEGRDIVTNSFKTQGRSPSIRWEIPASSCHQGHGNEGTRAASRLSFLCLSKAKVLLEMVVKVGQMSPCPSCNKVSAL